MCHHKLHYPISSMFFLHLCFSFRNSHSALFCPTPRPSPPNSHNSLCMPRRLTPHPITDPASPGNSSKASHTNRISRIRRTISRLLLGFALAVGISRGLRGGRMSIASVVGLLVGREGGGRMQRKGGGNRGDVRVRTGCSLVAWVLEGCCCSWARSVEVDERNERRWGRTFVGGIGSTL